MFMKVELLWVSWEEPGSPMGTPGTLVAPSAFGAGQGEDKAGGFFGTHLGISLPHPDFFP